MPSVTTRERGNLNPRIATLAEKILVGKRTKMSFSDNRTFELWRSFMPRRKEIGNSIGADLYSVEVYPPLFWEKFSADTEFEKCAAVEVSGRGLVLRSRG
jgi:AraC family transcriptional regulator